MPSQDRNECPSGLRRVFSYQTEPPQWSSHTLSVWGLSVPLLQLLLHLFISDPQWGLSAAEMLTAYQLTTDGVNVSHPHHKHPEEEIRAVLRT